MIRATRMTKNCPSGAGTPDGRSELLRDRSPTWPIVPSRTVRSGLHTEAGAQPTTSAGASTATRTGAGMYVHLGLVLRTDFVSSRLVGIPTFPEAGAPRTIDGGEFMATLCRGPALPRRFRHTAGSTTDFARPVGLPRHSCAPAVFGRVSGRTEGMHQTSGLIQTAGVPTHWISTITSRAAGVATARLMSRSGVLFGHGGKDWEECHSEHKSHGSSWAISQRRKTAITRKCHILAVCSGAH